MNLQEEMFRLIEEWKSSGLRQKEFLENSSISRYKFKYWLMKYRQAHGYTNWVVSDEKEGSVFKEIKLPSLGDVSVYSKVIELITPSGIHITVFG